MLYSFYRYLAAELLHSPKERYIYVEVGVGKVTADVRRVVKSVSISY
jgi:hypothetical protein